MAGPMPPVANTISMQFQGTIPGEVWENILHFGYSGPTPTQSSMATFAAAATNSWSIHVSPMQATSVVLVQVTATDIASDSGAQGVSVVNVAGSKGANGPAANAAILVSYPIPTRYRGGHPRSYVLAGLATDLDSPMHWSTGFTSGFNPAWQSLLTGIIGVSAGGTQITQLVAVRRHGKFLPNAGPPNFVLTTPIVYPLIPSSIVVHNQVASQKGRIGRRSK